MDGTVLIESDVHQVVNLFLSQGLVVEQRDQICGVLGLSYADTEEIKLVTNLDRSENYGFFTKALTKWIGSNTGGRATKDKLVQLLRSEKYNAAADELSALNLKLPRLRQNSREHVAGSRVWFEVPDQVSMFTGRQVDIEKLQSSILKQNSSTEEGNIATVITALAGTGGIGKTSLTIHYAWEFYRNRFYANVIWINCENMDTVKEAFRRLAHKLGKSSSSLDLKELMLDIYEHFGQTKTLIIFDNLDDKDNFDLLQMPLGSPDTVKPYVLITSRKQCWKLLIDVIDLKVFKSNDSVDFFVNFLRLASQEEKECAREISLAVQNLPLAIRQSAAFIKCAQHQSRKPMLSEMKSYLDAFKLNDKRVLDFKFYEEIQGDIYKRTILNTWATTMDKLKAQCPLTDTITKLIAYFSPDNIPKQLLFNIPRMGRNREYRKISTEEINVAIELLHDFSMITLLHDSNSLSVHRLLQKVVRVVTEIEVGLKNLQCAVKLMISALNSKDFDDYNQLYLIHALAVQSHIPQNDESFEGFKTLVVRKQNDSIAQNIILLEDKLAIRNVESKLVLDLYEEIRKKYSDDEARESGTSLIQIFTLRFAKYLCSKFINLQKYSVPSALELWCSVCERVFEDLPTTSGSKNETDFSDVVGCSYILTCDTSSMPMKSADRNRILECSIKINRILFHFFKTSRGHHSNLVRIYLNLLTNYADSKNFVAIHDLMEDFCELSLEWDAIDAPVLFDLIDCYEKICKLYHQNVDRCTGIKVFQSLFAQHKQFLAYLIRQELYALAWFYYGPVMISFCSELCKFDDLLESVTELVVAITKLSNPQRIKVLGARGSLTDVPDALLETPGCRNCSIAQKFVEVALEMYKNIYDISLANDDNRELCFSVVGILNCFAELNAINAMYTLLIEFKKIMTAQIGEVQKSVSVYNTHKHLFLCYSQVPYTIFNIVKHPNCVPDRETLLEYAFDIFKIMLKSSEANRLIREVPGVSLEWLTHCSNSSWMNNLLFKDFVEYSNLCFDQNAVGVEQESLHFHCTLHVDDSYRTVPKTYYSGPHKLGIFKYVKSVKVYQLCKKENIDIPFQS